MRTVIPKINYFKGQEDKQRKEIETEREDIWGLQKKKNTGNKFRVCPNQNRATLSKWVLNKAQYDIFTVQVFKKEKKKNYGVIYCTV